MHRNGHRAQKKAKNDFEKNLFRLMNNSVFGKTTENVREDRNIKLVTTEKKKLFDVGTNYSTKIFKENLLAIEMRKKSNICE